MSFKSCDPGIVFELRLSESSVRECLRSPPTRARVWVYGEGGGDLVFPKFTSCKLFWDYYSGVKNRWNPFKVEWKDSVVRNGGRFSNSTKVKNKTSLQTKWEETCFYGQNFYVFLAILNIVWATKRWKGFLCFPACVCRYTHTEVCSFWKLVYQLHIYSVFFFFR